MEQRNDPLRFRDCDRGGQEQQIFEEANDTFDPTLILVGHHQFLIGVRLTLQLIGADNETGLSQSFLGHPRLVDGDGRHDLPLVGNAI